MSYRLAPIEEYSGRENAGAVLHLADLRIEVFNCFYDYCRIARASTFELIMK